MLSICITVKNRCIVKTEHGNIKLLPRVIESLIKCLPLSEEVELVISDWKSDDFPLKEWLMPYTTYFPIHFITIDGKGFSKGKGQNIAADHASGNLILFTDTDVLLTKEVLQRGINIANHGDVYYPTIRYQIEYDGKEIIHEGGGITFMNKEIFDKSGKWLEFQKHGFEDTEMVHRVKKITNIVTDSYLSLLHLWHPQSPEFKNAYSIAETLPPDVEYMEVKKRCEDIVQKDIEFVQNQIKNVIYSSNTTHSSLNRPVNANNRNMII